MAVPRAQLVEKAAFRLSIISVLAMDQPIPVQIVQDRTIQARLLYRKEICPVLRRIAMLTLAPLRKPIIGPVAFVSASPMVQPRVPQIVQLLFFRFQGCK